jgi:hypothetical protein
VERVIRVSVAVGSETVRFRAESIEEAVRLASVSYPGGTVRVLFPIDPNSFFIEKPVPASEKVLADARRRRPPGELGMDVPSAEYGSNVG